MRLTDGLKQAYLAGAIDKDQLHALYFKGKAAQEALAAQQRMLANDTVAAKLKAMGYGAGRCAAFLAGAPLGAGIGAEIGAFGGLFDPITVPVGAAIGGLITGGVAAWSADKVLRKLGEYSDTIRRVRGCSPGARGRSPGATSPREEAWSIA